jgi:hypothetical protein
VPNSVEQPYHKLFPKIVGNKDMPMNVELNKLALKTQLWQIEAELAQDWFNKTVNIWAEMGFWEHIGLPFAFSDNAQQ